MLTIATVMHNQGLIHTDLKPENICYLSDSQASAIGYSNSIDGADMVRLIDFGGATFQHSHHGRVVATQDYRAPEVLLSASHISLSLYLSVSLTYPLTRARTHSLPHSLTRSLTHSLAHSLTHSLTHSLAHSLTHSLTHPPTHSLTRSLARSLIYSHTHRHEERFDEEAWHPQERDTHRILPPISAHHCHA